jgi:exosortase/archaeosortase family protein
MMGHLVSIVPVSAGPTRRIASGVRHLATAVRDRLEQASQRVAGWPPSTWPLLAATAAWPSLAWSLRRFGDRSDDPFGIVAWCALLFALAAALPFGAIPDLLRALAATIAIVLALAAIIDDDEPFVPYAGFALLALPLLSSLQFFAGFPLRVVTAEASRWLLTLDGWQVVRDGTTLAVGGRTILVDAPCSGVQMAWVGYFTACCAVWLFRIANGAALRRMPLVGMLVLLGNVARNTVLVDLEARAAVDDRLHAAIGLATTALVCGAIVAAFASCRVRIRALRRIRVETRGRFFAPAPPSLGAGLACAGFAIASLLPFAARPAAAATATRAIEWPTSLDGDALVPIALSDVERRFAAGFPGSIARFANGSRTVVLREIDRPTRRLHPAADCFRALGYATDREHVERDAAGNPRRCFAAHRGDGSLNVCEQIVDHAGHVFVDASSWYWAALLGRSQGPWRAVTIAQRE